MPRPISLRSLAATALALSLALATAQEPTWPWFVEPFSVDMVVETPEMGTMDARLFVADRAVRLEIEQLGMKQVMIMLLEGEGVTLRVVLPDGIYVEQVYERDDLPELYEQGYVAAVTPPDDPGHPCTMLQETHRCQMLGTETLDGRSVERWRIDAEGRDGAPYGQFFYFDRALSLVVRAEDDSGAIITYSNHTPGPQPAELFEVPAGYQRIEAPAIPLPGF